MTAVAPSAETLIVRTRNGLTRRGRALAAIVGILLVLIGVSAGSALAQSTGLVPAAGTTDNGTRDESTTEIVEDGDASPEAESTLPGSSPADAIQAEWDGPAVHLAWTGERYTTAEASFVGFNVASPGDRVERTLSIVNDGPGAGVMTVAIPTDQLIPEGAENPDLAESISLDWRIAGAAAGTDVTGTATFAELLRRDDVRTPITEVTVPRGTVVTVAVGFSMPYDETAREEGSADSTWLTFDVEVALRGAAAHDPIIPVLPPTGVTVGLLVGAAIGLAALGAWLLLAGRRRDRCEACDAELEPGDHWAVRLFPEAEQQVLCDDCYAAYGAGHGLLAARA